MFKSWTDNIIQQFKLPEMDRAVNQYTLSLFLKDQEKFNEVRAAVKKQQKR